MEWVDEMKSNILPAYNDYIASRKKATPAKPLLPRCSGDDCELLSVGDQVRIPYDEPKRADDEQRLSGNFRATDLRFDPTVRTISKVLVTPGQPPLYVVEPIRKKGKQVDPWVAYTKTELHIVDPEEADNREAQTFFLVKKIRKERGRGKQKEYLVEWNDFPDEIDFSWEPSEYIQTIAPDAIKRWKK